MFLKKLMAINLSDISFYYKKHHSQILKIPEWKLTSKSKIFIQGASGTGKTTFLNILCGLISPQKGKVELFGTQINRLNATQRDSFRAHILNAVENSLAPVDITAKADSSQEENELEEEVSLDIDVEKDKFIPVRDQDMPEEAEEAEPETFQDLSGMNVTGRNFASTTFNKVENQILDAYESLADGKDRDLYKEYMLTNLKLYFDRFEEELQPSVPEPESPDYNK